MAISISLSSADAHAASLEDQNQFAEKMKKLLRNSDYDYAHAAMLKYLELEPDAAPVKRELAHYYMKTSAQNIDGLLSYQYPEDSAEKIVDLLDQVIVASPNDHEALSLLVYTHALQGNIELGQQALDRANAIAQKAEWLGYNSALLAIADNRLSEAVKLLSPIAIDKVLPKGVDSDRIYSSAWSTLRKLGISDPKLDSLTTVREGLATRVDIRQLPEYVLDYDRNGPPLLINFSSQDKNCTYCVPELTAFHEFARRNKEQGKKYNIIYVSTEPWGDIKKYKDILDTLYISGLPAYAVVHRGEYISRWTGARPEALAALLDNYDWFLENGILAVKVVPRQQYLLDHMLYQFNDYKKNNKKDFRAMAYAVKGRFWTYSKKAGFDTQDAADEAALNSCKEYIAKRNVIATCKIYARADTIVDPIALARNKDRAAERKKVTRRKEKREKQDALAETKNDSPANNLTDNNGSPLSAIAKPTTQRAPKSVSEAIRIFTKIEEHYKALAMAQDGELFVTASASKELTQHRANQRALINCEAARQEKAVSTDCQLHTIGQSEVTEQSDKTIKKLTARQQKKNAIKSAIGPSFKKFRKFSADKAYAISVADNGQWVYGMAFGLRGTDKAAADAISECDVKRAEKGLTNACQVLILNSKFVEQGQ